MAYRLCAAVLAGLVLTAPAVSAQSQERCYGVAKAGENDGIGRDETPGSSTRDYQGNAWIWVPAGTCLTMPLPEQPAGTPRRGALQPLDRDRP
jgi:uncharacterized membrane protein